MAVIFVLTKFVTWFLYAVMAAMLGRAILSWFTMGGQSTGLGSFLYVVTEPFILPVRRLCERFGWFEGLPFDMPFMITNLILVVVVMLLGG